MKSKILSLLLLVSSLTIMILSLSSDKFNITARAYFKSILWLLKTPQKTETPFKQMAARIWIPITINGQTYQFLWDTGCTVSFINRKIIEDLDLPISDIKGNLIALDLRKRVPYRMTKPIDLKIADIDILAPLVFLDEDYMDGIIGLDIINKYSWIFDFKTKTATISEQSQKLDLTPAERRFDFEISSKALGKAYFDVLVNDSIKKTFQFDTGYNANNLTKGSLYLNTDLHVNVPNNYSLEKVFANMEFLFSQEASLLTAHSGGEILEKILVKGVKLNEYNSSLMSISVDHDDFYIDCYEFNSDDIKSLKVPTIITSNFLNRFNKLYYDYSTKTCSFIQSSSDTTLYSKKNVDAWFKSFSK